MAFTTFLHWLLERWSLARYNWGLGRLGRVSFNWVYHNAKLVWILTYRDGWGFIAPWRQLSIYWPWSLSLLLAKPFCDPMGIAKDQNWPVKICQQIPGCRLYAYVILLVKKRVLKISGNEHAFEKVKQGRRSIWINHFQGASERFQIGQNLGATKTSYTYVSSMEKKGDRFTLWKTLGALGK